MTHRSIVQNMELRASGVLGHRFGILFEKFLKNINQCFEITV